MARGACRPHAAARARAGTDHGNPAVSRLTTRVRPRAELSDAEIHAMFALYECYYDGTSEAIFREDLSGKSHVLMLESEGELRGFSTIAVIDFEFEGAANRAVFSGDTIIDQQFWGEQELVRAFCRFCGALKATAPQLPLFWLLISKGYRTYRYLEAFAHDYQPHHSRTPTREARARLDTLARHKFGASFDAAAGLLRFPESRGHLKPRWAEVRDPLQQHPAVQFFLERNPRFYAGEELVCLTELVVDNLRSFAKRAFLEGFGQRAAVANA
jgi:hypothetical protein